MAPIPIFQADVIPRYGVSEQQGLVGNLVSQRAFLTSMIVDQCAGSERSFELRLASSSDGGIDVFVAVHGRTDGASQLRPLDRDLIARLLPPDYGWRTPGRLRTYDDIAGELSVARVVRTTQFVDLPYAVSDPQGRTHEIMNSLVTNNSDTNFQAGPTVRTLPDLSGGPLQVPDHRICLPFLGAINGWRVETRVLLEQMLTSSPAIISICMRPLQETELASARVVAPCWRQILDPVLGQLANSGFADVSSLAGVFDRFSMPARHLIQVSIKCAAQTEDAAVSVASVLAACLGGATAYEVCPPSKGPVSSLTRMDTDYPVPGDLEAQRLKRELKKQLDAAGVAGTPDEESLDFLIRLPHVYTLDEVHSVARLPVSDDEGLPGVVTRMPPPFSAPWRKVEQGQDNVRIGQVLPRYSMPATEQADHVRPWYRLSPDALTKHALIVGSTGSGKTLTTQFLARELERNKIPFLVIEPVKTEYYDRLAQCMIPGNLVRYRLEGSPTGEEVGDFLAFDPMTLQEGVSVARHASYLKSCFLAAFPLPPVEALLLEAGLREYYTAPAEQLGCGFKLFTRGSRDTAFRRDEPVAGPDGMPLETRESVLHPSFAGFCKFFSTVFLERMVFGGRPQDSKALGETLIIWQQMFIRRFESVKSGPIGLAMERAKHEFDRHGRMPTIQDFLVRNTIIELDGIPDEEQKSLMMAFLLSGIYERRQADDLMWREAAQHVHGVRDDRPRGIQHVLIVEEAHRVLSAGGALRGGETAGLDAKAKSVSMFVDMLAEIRAFGQGIVIVEQIPTKIVSEAIKNTNLKVMLRLTSSDDREYLGAAMNLTDSQKRFVATLRAEPGVAINMVAFEEGVEQPVMLTLPLSTSGSGDVFDHLFPEECDNDNKWTR